MPHAATCPDISLLERLTKHELEEAAKQPVLEHLEHCDSCAQTVGTFKHSDTLLDLVRTSETISQGIASSEVESLITKLRGLNPNGGAAPADIDKTANVRKPVPTLSLTCGGCGKTLKIKGTPPAGKTLHCPNCQHVLELPGAEAATLQREAKLTNAKTSAPVAASGQETLAYAPKQDAGKYDFLAPALQPDELGRLGPYRVLQVLGAGGMGVVFRAEDPSLERQVALKAMLPSMASVPSSADRFLREARAAAKVKHDNVVTIHQVGLDRGVPFLAMEFLEGESLEKRLVRERKLPRKEVLRIAREIAEGLAAAHEMGLVHRDIKPANIWLEGGRARVKILDFGLVRGSGDNSQLTQAGLIVGTPAFMSPEQASGKALDARSDLFSLGCVFYAMCAGELPFVGSDPLSTLLAVATHEPPPIHDIDPSLPEEFADMIMQLLAKKPEDRPCSARAVAEKIAAIETRRLTPRPERWRPKTMMTKKPVSPPPAAPPTRKRARKRAPLIWGVLAGILVLGIGGAWLASIVFRVDTEQGTLYVETDDEDVNVKVSQGGKQVTIIHPKSAKEVVLKIGTYDFELVDSKPGLSLRTRSLSLSNGDRKALEIRYEPRPGSEGQDKKGPPQENPMWGEKGEKGPGFGDPYEQKKGFKGKGEPPYGPEGGYGPKKGMKGKMDQPYSPPDGPPEGGFGPKKGPKGPPGNDPYGIKAFDKKGYGPNGPPEGVESLLPGPPPQPRGQFPPQGPGNVEKKGPM